MKNSIKMVMLMNAVKNIKVAAKSGGKGSFSMKGLSFDMRDHDVILRKVGNEVKESLHKSGIEVSIGAIELSWNFPIGWGKFEEGKLEFSSEEEASLSLLLQGIRARGKNEDFELEELALEGVQQIQSFFMELPLDDLAKLAAI